MSDGQGRARSVSRLLALGLRFGAIALNFAVQVVMARVMRLEEFGLVNTALALMNILVVPAALGYDGASTRFVAVDRDDPGRLRALTRRFARDVTLASIATSVAIAVAALVQRALGGGSLWVALALLVVVVPAFAFLRVAEGWLRGMGSLIWAQLGSGAIVPMGTIALLLAQRPAGAVGVFGAMAARAVATGGALALAAALVVRRLRRQVAKPAVVGQAEEVAIRRVAIGLTAIGVLSMVVSQVDVLAVSLLAGAEDAGLYSAAARIALAMNVAVVAVNFVLAPRAARLFARQEMRRLQEEVSSAATWSLAIMLGGGAVVFVMSPVFLRAFGPDFDDAAEALRILVLGQMFNGLCGPVGTVLKMTGHERAAVHALALAVVVDLVLLAALIPAVGLGGAAIATAVCTLVWNGAMLAALRRSIGVWALPGWIVRRLP